MSASAKPVVDGWDAYSVAQAKAYLLTEAAAVLLQAHTKKTPGDRAVALRMVSTRCVVRVCDVGKKPRQVAEEATEDSFHRFLRKTFDLDDKAASAIVERVKFNARTLRGQLDLFEKADAS